MIMMRFFLPLPTSRLDVARSVVAAGLGAALIASCGVDQAGLGTMPFLPHDASSADTSSAGVAGVSGNPGVAGASGTGGGAGSVPSGIAGTGGSSSVAGMGGSGVAGVPGTAGIGGNAAGAAGTSGDAGTSGAAGAGGVGGDGAAGTGGSGVAGIAGTIGTAGTGGSTAGAGGDSTGTGGGIAGAAGTGGTAGTTGVAGTGGGAAGRGGSGGTGGSGPCTPLNCSDGCCSTAGACIRARTVTQCGANGQTCAPCGGCQFCSTTGQCRIDTASRWTIVAAAAKLDTSNSWDRFSGDLGGSAPDPFCEYENPAGQVTSTTAGVTDTLIDTYNPNWNQVITPPGATVSAATLMANSPAWQIWIGDDDNCSGLGCFGEVACTIRQTITETNLRSGQLIVTNRQQCNSVTINFVCQP
jgi:hypothetical protein